MCVWCIEVLQRRKLWVMVEDNIAVAAVAAEVLCNIMRWLLLGCMVALPT